MCGGCVARAARPYAEEMTNALAALGGNASLQHPMLTGVENPKRSGILVITSDRGLAGGYSSNAIKRANDVAARIESEGKEPVRYVIGRKGVGYFRFRRLEVAGAFTGFSEQPNFDAAREAIDTVVAFKTASRGVSNALLRDLAAVHPNTTPDDLPAEVRAAIASGVRAAFTRLQKEGYVIAPSRGSPTPPAPPPALTEFTNRARALVQVQAGCDHRCTFCVIPQGRGPSRSVPPGPVVD